ncbi:MAG: sigma-70 family RNA polymerase sigma factor [Calditrichaeota bacterium]|nr:sigma-70 family RNA polymerase sigma factor [Calditrichota bacterium]
MDQNEVLLIHRAQEGHVPSFEQLVRLYDENIMQLLCHLLNDIEDAKDVYQDVFFKVYKSINSFRFRSEFYTWLYRIAVNTAINFRNKRKKIWQMESAEYLAANDSGFSEPEDSGANPESHLLNSELSLKIAEAIDKLSPKQRAVFILRHYQGMKLAEIANVLESSEGTIKNYLFRAMQKMKRNLQKYEAQ